jgi:hypothetical protein
MEALQPYMSPIIYGLAAFAAIVVLLFGLRAINKRERGRRGSRLSISEYCEIDDNRRLVIVRRDEVEHLLLIGGPQDVVVETDISAPVAGGLSPRAGSPANLNVGPTLDTGANIQPIRPAPRPAVFGDRRAPLRPVEPVVSLTRNDRE